MTKVIKMGFDYVSQIGVGANEDVNDCLAGAVNPITMKLGIPTGTVDETFNLITGDDPNVAGTIDRPTYLSEGVKYLNSKGILAVAKGGMGRDLLESVTERKQPFIPLIKHAYLTNREIKASTYNHYVLLEEMDPDGVGVMDPYQYTDNHPTRSTWADFMTAWEMADLAYQSGILVLHSLDEWDVEVKTVKAKINFFPSQYVRIDPTIKSSTTYIAYNYGYEFDVVANRKIESDGYVWRQIVIDGRVTCLFIAERLSGGQVYLEINGGEPEPTDQETDDPVTDTSEAYKQALAVIAQAIEDIEKIKQDLGSVGSDN